MNHRITIVTIIASALMIVSAACRRVDDVVYSEFETIPTDGWNPAFVASFAPWPADSVMTPGTRYDLQLTIRYSPSQANTEIPLEITEEDETGITDVRDITVHLRDADGNPRGRKGVFLYEISDTLRKAFTPPAEYLVEIATLSPEANTRGIRNVGVTMIRRP